MSTSKFKKICVFCGSSLGKKKSYQDAAIDLGKELVMKNIDLVYGGGNLGVIPKALMDKEITGVTIGEIKPIENMHQRKAEMSLHADAFIAMPGGYGTLEELFEVITWAQLGIHSKPVGLLNIDGYYNSLLSFIDQAVEEGFIKPSAHHIIVSASNAKELIDKLEDYYPCYEEVALKLNWNSEQLDHSQNNVENSASHKKGGKGSTPNHHQIHGINSSENNAKKSLRSNSSTKIPSLVTLIDLNLPVAMNDDIDHSTISNAHS